MTTSRPLTMRFALRAAAAGKLEDGWLYFPRSENPGLDTVCVLVTADDGDSESVASALGFPYVGLDTATIEDTANAARQFQATPSDELLLESFVYYWRFDAWLPEPGAPEPPPLEEVKLRLDREFFDGLGEERPEVSCKAQACSKGAVQYSIFCRIHHFEMVGKKPCPFVE